MPPLSLGSMLLYSSLKWRLMSCLRMSSEYVGVIAFLIELIRLMSMMLMICCQLLWLLLTVHQLLSCTRRTLCSQSI